MCWCIKDTSISTCCNMVIKILLVLLAFSKVTIRASRAGFSYNPYAYNGPANWGNDPDYATCSSGTSQSPVDLPRTADSYNFYGGPGPSFYTATFDYEKNANNFEFKCKQDRSCGSTVFRGIEYYLVNIHMHSPSEHTISGAQFPLEMHMVHQASPDQLAVIPTFFEPSAPYFLFFRNDYQSSASSLLSTILQGIVNGQHEFIFNPAAFLGTRGYMVYSGSLTTPPCSETVTWMVAREFQEVSDSDINTYTALTNSREFGNNRPVQPLNGRSVIGYFD